MESGRIGGGSPYRGYPQSIPDVKNNDIDIENVGDESGQFSDFKILCDVEVELFESTDVGAKWGMLSLVNYEYETDPEIIDAKSTFEFVKNLTMKDGLWNYVCINGDVDPDIIAAIPHDIAYIYIGARATSNCISAIPSHISIVKICIGVNSEAVAALPESVFAVFIANGVSPDTVKSLPTHIKLAVVEDRTCKFPMRDREVIGKGGAVLQNGVVKLAGKLRQNKIATLDALPSHVTEILEMNQVIIVRDKSNALATLKHTYTNGTTESPSTCSSVIHTTSLNNLNEMESFFDVKRPSALKVIDIKTANVLLTHL